MSLVGYTYVLFYSLLTVSPGWYHRLSTVSRKVPISPQGQVSYWHQNMPFGAPDITNTCVVSEKKGWKCPKPKACLRKPFPSPDVKNVSREFHSHRCLVITEVLLSRIYSIIQLKTCHSLFFYFPGNGTEVTSMLVSIKHKPMAI